MRLGRRGDCGREWLSGLPECRPDRERFGRRATAETRCRPPASRATFAPDERVGSHAAFGEPGLHDVGLGGPELSPGRRPEIPDDVAGLGQRIGQPGLNGGGTRRCGNRPRHRAQGMFRAAARRRLLARGVFRSGLAGLGRAGGCLPPGSGPSHTMRANALMPGLKVLDVQLVSVRTVKAYSHRVAAPSLVLSIIPLPGDRFYTLLVRWYERGVK